MIGEWQEPFSYDQRAQSRWQPVDGGHWAWHDEAVRVKGTGLEWVAFRWLTWNSESARALKNFLIEVTIAGKAGAAGLSFGAYKDFLAEVDERSGPRHLQLEVDVEADRWALRIDGQLLPRCWWDSAVNSVEDILNGELRLKVRHADEVFFRDLKLHQLDASCQLSVIITCSRFLQRLRLSLRNWCHQDLPSGAHEVLVVNPHSPDGTHEHLSAVARSYPHVRVREIAVRAEQATNKGAMINCAVALCRGEWIWLTDADCLFRPDCARHVLQAIGGQSNHLYYGERRFLTAAQTDALLSGRMDPLRDFDELAAAAVLRQPERYQWGYTQVFHRSTAARVRYGEEHKHFAHSDGIFAQACRRHGIQPRHVDGLYCLHLDHPFAWYGAPMFL